jgi:hypothetical protein
MLQHFSFIQKAIHEYDLPADAVLIGHCEHRDPDQSDVRRLLPDAGVEDGGVQLREYHVAYGT